MKKFYKIVRYIFPYWILASLNVFFNALSAFFALFSFLLSIPTLEILFQTQTQEIVKVPFELSREAIEQNMYYYLQSSIMEFGQAKTLFFICCLVVIMVFLKTFCRYLANYFLTPVRTRAVRDIRNNIYSKILTLPLSYYSEARKGDIMSRISNDVREIEISIMNSLEMMFRDPLTIIIYLVSMFILSVKLTLFALIMLPLSGLLIGGIGRNLKSISMKGQKQMGTLLSLIEETLSGLKIIKAFNAEEKASNRFFTSNNVYTKIMNRVHRRRFLANPLSEFLATMILMLLMWYGGSLVFKEAGTLSSPTLISFFIIFSQIIVPAKALSTAYFNIRKGMASADRIDYILDAEVSIKDVENPKSIEKFKSLIEFKNVSFRYEQDLVLKNINLKIEKGKTTAIVGRSGAGKSTLVDLIPRFIDISEGELFLDDISIKEYKISDIRKLMGIVTQQSILFNDNFFNNIAFGIKDPAEEDIIAAAKVANAHAFIMESPEGYYTGVGDAGSKLSGGQRQRISIARALLKNPPLLILDEATSALDTESERLVQEAIINLMKNRTSIVIAHRLSTIKYANEIIVIEEGEIVERGKHSKLMALDGVYKKLHDLQMF